MFKQARIKLTIWYLMIIMAISLSFSAVVYGGVNKELGRIENSQKKRIQKIIGGFPVPFELPPQDIDAIAEARKRIIFSLGLINLSILSVAGAGGFFLAGRTLDPIAKMVRDQKTFIGDASHELRTPITSLKTAIEVSLRDKKMTLADAKKLLKSNLEDVNKMQQLSNYLLKMNRYENGTKLLMTKVDLKEVTLKAIGKRNIKTDLKKSFITGNSDAVTELISILVDNAIKYSPKNGSVSIKVGDGSVEVKDNGVGIAEEDLPHIFNRFYRADTSRDKIKTDGYGLGLSIAKSIADAHGVKIIVQSKIGQGSVFRVDFNSV